MRLRPGKDLSIVPPIMARAMVVNRFLAVSFGALALLSTTGAVAAPTKAAAPRTAQVKPRSAQVTKTVKPTKPTKAAKPVAEPATTDSTLLVEYQRIFRELKKLEDLRGADCVRDLWAEYREIKPA